jgi:ABC-type nitrate/sulfonate/bicarbonate transport system substrate-binding protein
MTPVTRRELLRRTAGAAVLLGTGGSVLSGCGDEGPAEPGDVRRLSVMMPSGLTMSYIAEVVAASSGVMRENGVDLDLQFARSSTQPVQQLLAGRVSLVRASALLMVQALQQREAPLVAVATMAQEIIFGVISSGERPVRSVSDLSGQTVGLTSLGGGAEQTLDIVLSSQGVNPASVQRLPTGNQAAAFAFVQKGEVQALFTSAEAVAGIELTFPGESFTLDLKGINPLLGNALVTTRQILQEREQDLVGYLKGLRSAMLTLRDPSALATLTPVIRKQWDLPALDRREQAAAAAAANADLWFAAGEQSLLRNVEENWSEGIASFERLGLVQAGTDPTSLYTNGLVDRAVP